MLKRILVGIGGTECTATAIEHAVALGEAHQAEVTAVAAVDVQSLERVGPVPLGAQEAAHELREHRLRVANEHIDAMLARFQERCRQAGVRCHVDRTSGNPFALLTGAARYHDLIVVGLRAMFEYGVVGERHEEPTAALLRLIGDGVRPILAVPEQYQPVQRVLIPYSGSMESAKTIKHFMRLRLWNGSQMRLVTFAGAHEDPQQLLRDMQGYCKSHGYDVEAQFVDHRPNDGLLAEARAWNADAVVMGNSARNYLVRRIFGETALQTMRESWLPLFLSQ